MAGEGYMLTGIFSSWGVLRELRIFKLGTCSVQAAEVVQVNLCFLILQGCLAACVECCERAHVEDGASQFLKQCVITSDASFL